MTLSRRELARLLGRSAAVWAAWWAHGCTSIGWRDAPSVSAQQAVDERLDRTLADPATRESSKALGRAYLESYGGSRDELRREIAWAMDRVATRTKPSDDLFRRAVHADFAEGEMVETSGWLLSHTEARFSALVALAE